MAAFPSRGRGPAPQEAARWTRVGSLAAVAMVLGYLETFVPIPIPGVKLGLANVTVLVLLALGDLRAAAGVAAVKVLASGLLFGSPLTLAYSLVGTALSLVCMAPLARLRTMRIEMVSVVGALAHEAGQLLVAQALLGTSAVWYASFPLLAAGCLTGLFCGVIARRAVTLVHEAEAGLGDGPAKAPKAADVCAPSANPLSSTSTSGLAASAKKPEAATLDSGMVASGSPVPSLDPRLALVALLCFWLVALHLSSLRLLAGACALALAACALARARLHDLARALVQVAFIGAITLVAQLLTLPADRALAEAACSGLRLCSIVLASVAFMASQTTEGLLDGIAWLLSPLRLLGAPVEGPLLALDVALGSLPTLVAGVSVPSLSRAGLRDALDLLPRVVADAYLQVGPQG